MKPRPTTLWLACALLALFPLSRLAAADGPPPRELASAAARELSAGSASQYWDLTVELKDGHRVLVRFLITNQGPGKRNGIAVGHVISPRGKVTHFRNGRLKKRWTLSQDGLALDIGKSHLDMHGPEYALKVNKPDAIIRLYFAPNALYRLPGKLVGKKVQLDLLALGAAVRGSLKLAGMSEPLQVEGWATLTHTISKRSETDAALRRIELFSQRGETPLYVADFLNPAGKRSRWLGYLEARCDVAFDPQASAADEPNRETLVPELPRGLDEPCLRRVQARTEFDLALGDAIQAPPKRGGKKPYWISRTLDFTGEHATGRVELGESFLRHDPLDDLPGPIRFLAGFGARPRRVWSPAQFAVTIPPSLNSESPLFQGQGIAAFSFLNPVTRR